MKRVVVIGIIVAIIGVGIGLGVYFPTRGGAPPSTVVPTADFGVDKTQVALGQEIHFTDQSTGDPTGWSWDFGDNTTSTEQNPSHAYSSMGSYTVTLTVTNAAGSDTEIKEDYIMVSAVPTADFGVDKAQVALGQEIHFTDQSTGDPTGWSWDFGDNTTSTEQNPSHAYSSMGSYTVTLTVTNAAGSDTDTEEDYILVFEVLEKPITDIMEALGSHQGVSVEDIDILFCQPITMECDRFAVGAIISDTKSMAFIYNVATHQITEIEVDYTALTDDEISALSCASKYASKWTGNKILPCEFTVANGEYSFKYYDGYYVLLDRWSFGWATVDLETATVEWGPHV